MNIDKEKQRKVKSFMKIERAIKKEKVKYKYKKRNRNRKKKRNENENGWILRSCFSMATPSIVL